MTYVSTHALRAVSVAVYVLPVFGRRVRAFALVVVVGVEWPLVDDLAGFGEGDDRVAVGDHGLHVAAGVLVADVELP